MSATAKESLFNSSVKNVGSVWVTYMPRLKKFKVMSKSYFSGSIVDSWGHSKVRADKWAQEQARVDSLQDAIDIANEVLLGFQDCQGDCLGRRG